MESEDRRTQLESLTGTLDRVSDSLIAVCGDRVGVLLSLVMMKLGVSWEATGALSKLLFDEHMSSTALRIRITNCLERLAQIPLLPADERLQVALPGLPQAVGLVDCFPVTCRGPSTLFNGKYKGKCRKYQLVVTLTGDVITVTSCHRMHRKFDGTVFSALGPGFEMEEWERLIGDKAYVACPRIITPTKLKRNRRLTTAEALMNKYIQNVRSPNERAVARLHQFRVMKYCPFSEKYSDLFVRLACLVCNLTRHQKWSTWVRQRREKAPNLENRLQIQNCQTWLRDENPNLAGRNSSKRARSANEYKSCNLDYQKKCKRCNEEKLRCVCVARGRGRARGNFRGRSGSTQAQSSGATSSTATSSSGDGTESSFEDSDSDGSDSTSSSSS